ncbi:hypothetical protein GOP47_0023406 [Adiantum capillus-veneris]|uniref:Uncharacterized protein n=1 Tax=Adiantum capillus-veneris TaxID=13818 RepID=A0A9D4U609_ADICA|nr:hypothetical protein GOP47_0023406 [Adiantum capillus-veneris]
MALYEAPHNGIVTGEAASVGVTQSLSGSPKVGGISPARIPPVGGTGLAFGPLPQGPSTYAHAMQSRPLASLSPIVHHRLQTDMLDGYSSWPHGLAFNGALHNISNQRPFQVSCNAHTCNGQFSVISNVWQNIEPPVQDLETTVNDPPPLHGGIN